MEDSTGQIICQDDHLLLSCSGKTVMALDCSLPGDKVVVQCVDGAEATVEARNVTVADRSFFQPGMIAVDRRGSQAGIITRVTTRFDLVRQDPGGDDVVVARGVSPAEVRRVRELCIGDYVVSGRWLGRVLEVSLDVDVLFDDGTAVCRVARAGSKLITVGKDRLNGHTNSCFYPGQRVIGGGGVFRACRWLKGYWKPSYVQGTVSRVQTASVLVHWAATSSDQKHLLVQPPPAEQRPANLTFAFPGDELCFWGVGDRCFLRNRTTASRRRAPPARRTRTRNQRKRGESSFERPMSVFATRTTVDVVWQDGSRQRDVPSVLLIPSVEAHGHDFFPGQRVVFDDALGVVRSFSCADQTVRVSWFVGASGTAQMDDCNDNESVVSAYDLRRSSEEFYGDIVVRRQSMEEQEESMSRHQCKQKKNTDAGFDLSWIGRIVDLCDDGRDVQVQWADGSTSKVSRHNITVVNQEDIGEMLQELGGWVQDNGDLTDDAAINGSSGLIADSGSKSDGNQNGSAAAGTILQAVIRLTSKMLARGRKYLENGSTMAEASFSELAASSSVGKGMSKSCATDSDESVHFPQFDVVQSPSDHHYLNSMEQATVYGRKWTRRVQKEWKILENNLPGTIYVRVFEDRMDLLRVAMVGAHGTPYHDGLFFFDLQLPPTYPDSPPLVNYWSFGLRVNPNLLESGMVCLSLLGTVGGKGNELWSPDSSTILQVLVSLQGLVLTAQPYYNEDGYASHAGTPVGHRNELPYSENAYLVSLQTMLHLLRRPPAGFTDLVKDHFYRHRQHVLRACKAYLEHGYLIGTLDSDGRAMEASTAHLSSVGFRLALANIVPRVSEALINIGAQLCE